MMRQRIKFQPNWPMRGRVIDDSTNFLRGVSGGAYFTAYFSELWSGLHHIWEEMGQPLMGWLACFLVVSDILLRFQTTACQRRVE